MYLGATLRKLNTKERCCRYLFLLTMLSVNITSEISLKIRSAVANSLKDKYPEKIIVEYDHYGTNVNQITHLVNDKILPVYGRPELLIFMEWVSTKSHVLCGLNSNRIMCGELISLRERCNCLQLQVILMLPVTRKSATEHLNMLQQIDLGGAFITVIIAWLIR